MKSCGEILLYNNQKYTYQMRLFQIKFPIFAIERWDFTQSVE